MEIKTDNTKNPVDWERRRYELAAALYFHDIRHTDMVYPGNRQTQWPSYIHMAAEMAVEAAGVFIDEYRRNAEKPMEEQSHAP